MADQGHSAGGDFPGFMSSFKILLGALSTALHTRLELFATELEEERERAKQTLVLSLFLFFGLGLGIILLTVFAVALFWTKGWIFAIGALAMLYLAIGMAAGLMLRKKILTRPGLFPATLAELAKDRDQLNASSHD
jgi:uncharacterized membrane protein YqjE